MLNGINSVSPVITLNQATNGQQSHARPFLYDLDGHVRFGVVWESFDSGSWNLKVRGVSTVGTALGSEVKFLDDSTGDQREPDVIITAGGETVIAWTQENTLGAEIWAAISKPSSGGSTGPFNKLDSLLLLPAELDDNLGNPGLTALSNGNFILTADHAAKNGSINSVFGIYDNDGAIIGDSREIPATSYFSGATATAELAKGNIFHITTEIVQDANNGSIIGANLQAQTFRVDIGRMFGLAETLSPDEILGEASVIMLTDGRLLGAAELIDLSAGSISLVYFSFDSYGARQDELKFLSDQFDVDNESIALAATPDGGFVAVWQSFSPDGGRVMIRRFDVDLNPIGDSEFVTDNGGLVLEFDPQVAITDAGEVLVTWTAIDFAGDSEEDIQIRTFTLDDLSVTGLTRTGTSARDILVGTGNDDTLEGLAGRDVLDGGAGADVLRGGLGNDLYIIDTRGDVIEGEIGYSLGGGIDTIRTFVSYTQPTNVELMRLGNEIDTDNLNGIGNDAPGTIVGNAGDNRLTGRGGDDKLRGNDGDDVLIGNTGQDTLSGGRGSDTFVYTGYSESRAGRDSRDFINGFDRGRINDDVIDLSGLDAITTNGIGDDAFTFIGKAAFSGTAGELRAKDIAGQNALIISGDHNGDGVADFQIFVNQTNFMTGSDFIL